MQIHNFLALDPSLSSTGYCVMDRNGGIIKAGRFVTEKSHGDTNKRISMILNSLNDEIVHKEDIWEVVSEDGFCGINKNTGLLLAKLRGAIFGKFSYLDFYEYEPSFVRKELGLKGNASKEEVAQYITSLYPDEAKQIGPYNDKQGKNKTSDIYDAIAVAIAHLRHKCIEPGG